MSLRRSMLLLAAAPMRRVLGLVAFTVIGAFAARGRPGNGFFYDGVGDIVVALVVGAIGAWIVLPLVGSVVYAVSKLRRRGRSWSTVAFGPAAVVLTLVMLLLSAGGRAARHQESVSEATPNPAGSQTEREKANLVASDWSLKRAPILKKLTALINSSTPFITEFTAKGNVPTVRQLAARTERDLERVRAEWAALPEPPFADLRSLDATVVAAIDLIVGAYSDYLAALTANAASGMAMDTDKGAIALLDSGDSKITRANTLQRAFGKRASALDAKYGIP